jgi:hypothetical protein
MMAREFDESEILIAAAAIANARGGRRGVPQITNILELLPAKLRDEVMEDARCALQAVAAQGSKT